MARKPDAPRDLREACVQEALAIIERDGLEALSLREVARRLGVSHQAPYRHYPSRDHLLAEVARRAFAAFAAHLDARPRDADPAADLEAMGRAYLDYAARHPLQYRLMFGTPLPDPATHPEMMTRGRDAFAMLKDAVAALDAARDPAARGADGRLDALQIWALLPGVATLKETTALKTLGLTGPLVAAMQDHAMARMHAGLHAPLHGAVGGAAGRGPGRRRLR
jgi:AcrR family transcriptional regulator